MIEKTAVHFVEIGRLQRIGADAAEADQDRVVFAGLAAHKPERRAFRALFSGVEHGEQQLVTDHRKQTGLGGVRLIALEKAAHIADQR